MSEQALQQVRNAPERWIWGQYLFGMLVFVVGQVLFTAVFVVGFLLERDQNQAFSGNLRDAPPVAVLVGMLLNAAVTAAGFVVLIRWMARRPVWEFGPLGAVRELCTGLGIGAGFITATVALVAALGGYQVSGVQLTSGFLLGVGLGIGPGVAEEVLFRGVFLRLLDKQIGSVAALAATSAFFGLVHLSNPGGSVWGAVAIAAEAGLLLGAAYLLTRRLWLAIGIHTGWNGAQSPVFGIDVSGSGLGPGDGLLVSTMDGPDWLTGGSMGIEGSVVAALGGLMLGAWLLRRAHRRGHVLPPARVLRRAGTP